MKYFIRAVPTEVQHKKNNSSWNVLMINTSPAYYLCWKMQEHQLGLSSDLLAGTSEGQKLCSRNNTCVLPPSLQRLFVLLLFSQSVVSDSLWCHGLQHARFPCPSLYPGACSNSYPLSQWCHPIISCSVVPFSSCPQSFLASEFFIMSWFSKSCGQSIGASASASVLPMNI